MTDLQADVAGNAQIVLALVSWFEGRTGATRVAAAAAVAVQACESTDELAEELRLIALATADTPEAGLLFRNVMLSSLDWYAIASNLRHAPRVAQRPVVQQTTAATQEPRRPDLRPVGADGTVGVRRAGRSGSGTDPLAGDPGAPF